MGMSETASILKAVGNLNKARIIAHLSKHRGETAEDLAKHLGYPLPTVYKYLRELEVAEMVESETKERKVKRYYPRDFKLEISPEKLMELFEQPSALNLYKAKSGDNDAKRLNEVISKAKSGRMTYRQAASTLGISYYEFILLLEEIDAADE